VGFFASKVLSPYQMFTKSLQFALKKKQFFDKMIVYVSKIRQKTKRCYGFCCGTPTMNAPKCEFPRIK